MINLGIIPTDFILEKAVISWRDVLWGYENKFLGWHSVVQFAEKRFLDGSEVDMETGLASITKEDAGEVGDILRGLAGKEPSTPDEEIKGKWLYLVLSWLFEKRSEFSDSLSYVEEVYADFGYPDEISGFVRYMPASDGYDPSKHTPVENEQRLLNNWKEYLNNNTS